MATASMQKSLGAYYTGELAANRLVQWAIRSGNAAVLDPSCGDGVFLAAASDRLRQLGSKSPKVCGIDVSPRALREARCRVKDVQLIESDFFDIVPASFSGFDAIVGNPPFVRYQTFNSDSDSKGHLRSMEAGVRLPKLASSWAPFLIHASRFLRRGGRLAMVMPSELGHAMYAKDVLKYLVQKFEYVQLEMFREKMFDEISQSTVLLMCEGYGRPCQEVRVFSSDSFLSRHREERVVDIDTVKTGTFRLTQCLLPDSVRSLYQTLAENERVCRLGKVADVGIGYVSGSNEFFHLSDSERQSLAISTKFLRPAALNLRGISGSSYDRDRWNEKRKSGEKVHLLSLPPAPKEEFPNSIQRYLLRGESDGIADRYKCRIRKFWYVVPHVKVADAFLSYMSGEMPSLVTNPDKLVAPNTIHLLRFLSGHDPASFALTWKNSLTRLSCELEGHALGGGLFKLEPSEAESVLVILPRRQHISRLLSHELRAENPTSLEETMDYTDNLILTRDMGLSRGECLSLRDAARRIEQWRKHK